MKRNKLRVLVTGGAGFIGSNLVKRLVNDGHDVYVIDNLWRGKIENLIESGKEIINLSDHFILADLREPVICKRYIRDFDLVYHLADVVAGVDYTFAHEHQIFHDNILINTNVISACLENSIRNIIYVGTACSYPLELQSSFEISILKEDQVYPAHPESGYGWSKLMGEYELELAAKTKAINVGILRLHNVYGPGVSFEEERSQVIPSLIKKALDFPEKEFIVWGSGKQYRDFVYIDDVIEALILIFNKGMNCGAIQIGSEEPVTIRELAETIIRISGKDITPLFDTTKPEGDRGRAANCDKAREVLEFAPRYSLTEGLKATYQWIEKKITNKIK